MAYYCAATKQGLNLQIRVNFL